MWNWFLLIDYFKFETLFEVLQIDSENIFWALSYASY